MKLIFNSLLEISDVFFFPSVFALIAWYTQRAVLDQLGNGASADLMPFVWRTRTPFLDLQRRSYAARNFMIGRDRVALANFKSVFTLGI